MKNEKLSPIYPVVSSASLKEQTKKNNYRVNQIDRMSMARGCDQNENDRNPFWLSSNGRKIKQIANHNNLDKFEKVKSIRFKSNVIFYLCYPFRINVCVFITDAKQFEINGSINFI
jgi:hypothetical protein